MKTILYLTYDGITEPIGKTQGLNYMLALAQNNYKIIIVSLEKKRFYKKNKQNIKKEIASYNSLKWFHLRYFETRFLRFIFHILHFTGFFIIAFIATLIYRPHVIHCRSYMPMLSGYILSWLFRKKIIFDARGFWIESRFDGKIWKNNILYKTCFLFMKKLERKFYAKSSCIIVLTRDAKEWLIESEKIKSEKIVVIPCASDITCKVNEEYARHVIPCIHGCLTDWYEYEKMFYFLSLIVKRLNTSFFILTHDIEKAKSLMLKFEIPFEKGNLKSVGHEEIPHYLKDASLGIIFLKDTFSMKGAFPVRLSEYICCGVPVVCNRTGGLKFVEEYSCGVVLESINEDFLSNNFQYIVHRVMQLNRKKIQEIGAKFLSLDAISKSYQELYKKFHSKYLNQNPS